MTRLMLVFVAAATCAAASAQPARAYFFIDSSSFEIQLTELRSGVFGILEEVSFETSEARVLVRELEMDSDPFIAYGLSVVDFGAPSIFAFSFSTPLAPPIGSPNVVAASLVGGLNDVTGDGVSITATSGPGVQIGEVDAPTTNMGVDIGPSASFGPGAPGAHYAYGPFAAGPQAGPVGLWTVLRARADFGLSGNGDIAALTGYLSIVPEPATLAGLAVGLLVLGRRRRKS